MQITVISLLANRCVLGIRGAVRSFASRCKAKLGRGRWKEIVYLAGFLSPRQWRALPRKEAGDPTMSRELG